MEAFTVKLDRTACSACSGSSEAQRPFSSEVMTGINKAGLQGWQGLIALWLQSCRASHLYFSHYLFFFFWFVFVFISQKRQHGGDPVILALLHFWENSAQSEAAVITSHLPPVALPRLSAETQSEIHSAIKDAYVRRGRGCKFRGTWCIFPSI